MEKHKRIAALSAMPGVVGASFMLLGAASAEPSGVAHSPASTRTESASAYASVLDRHLGRRWSEQASSAALNPKVCASTKAVVSFKLDRRGGTSRIKLKHCSLESILPLYRERYQADCRRLDQALVAAVKAAAPLPPPPSSLKCPCAMVVLFDVQRFRPLRVMYDDPINSRSELEPYAP